MRRKCPRRALRRNVGTHVRMPPSAVRGVCLQWDAPRPGLSRLRWSAVGTERTTAAIQRYLADLGGSGDSRAQPVVRDLLERSVGRLRLLCSTMLYRNYPRLARPPLNLQVDEMLSAVVERLLRA